MAEMPAPDDDDALAAELVSGDVVGHVQLASGEAFPSRVRGPERFRPGAGGVDDRPCSEHGGGGVGARGVGARCGLDEEPTVRVVVLAADGADLYRAADREGETLLERREVRRDDVDARGGRIELGLRHAGQVVDPVDGRHGERPPSVLPGAARGVVRVEDDEGACCGRALGGAQRDESAAMQVVRGRQSGLTRADHDDVDGLRSAHVLLNVVDRSGISDGVELASAIQPWARTCTPMTRTPRSTRAARAMSCCQRDSRARRTATHPLSPRVTR